MLLAQAGQLDPTFHNDGYVTTIPGPDPSWNPAVAAALQSDEKIVVRVEEGVSSNYPVTVVRYSSNGFLDTTFGSNGVVRSFYGMGVVIAGDVAVQSDGKILAGGSIQDPAPDLDMFLTRFNPDGSLDSTFGVNGYAQSDIGFANDEASPWALAVRDDGRIIQAGASNVDLLTLVGYLTNGALDPAFGVNGIVTLGGSWYAIWPFDILMQPDGKILVSGHMNFTIDSAQCFVARFNEDGALDSSFAMAGIATLQLGSQDLAGLSLALRPDGRIIVGGFAYGGTMGLGDMVLIQYLSTGVIDTAFGAGGHATYSFDPIESNDRAITSLVQPDGKVILFGYTQSSFSEPRFALLRVDSTGLPDPTFGTDGMVTTSLGGPEGTWPYQALLQPDGKILGIGLVYDGPDTGMALTVRYLADGSVDLHPQFPLASGMQVLQDEDALQVTVADAFTHGFDLRIFDAQGRLVAQHRIDARTTTVPVPTLRPGLYIGRVANGDQIAVAKFLIE